MEPFFSFLHVCFLPKAKAFVKLWSWSFEFQLGLFSTKEPFLLFKKDPSSGNALELLAAAPFVKGLSSNGKALDCCGLCKHLGKPLESMEMAESSFLSCLLLARGPASSSSCCPLLSREAASLSSSLFCSVSLPAKFCASSFSSWYSFPLTFAATFASSSSDFNLLR